jgi:hypothetical protein
VNLEKFLYGAAIASTVLFIFLSTTGNTDLLEDQSWPIEDTCLGSHSSEISHIHSSLSIFIEGEEYSIPQNIGIQDSSCPDGMRGIHTHDDTGRLHIETPSQIDAPVGAFFNIWGEVFNSEQIFDNYADSDYELVMFVNGEANNNFEKYIMLDGDEISIHYQQK